MGVDTGQAALAIFDCFKGQVTDEVVNVLEEHNIDLVIIPAKCTDRLQPLDQNFNKTAKSFLQRQFQDWYANEISTKFNTSTGTLDDLVDLSTSRMKNVGVPWLIHLYEHLSDNPLNIVNGFLAAQIPQSIDASIPVIPATSNNSDEESSVDEYSNEEDESASDDYFSKNELSEDETEIIDVDYV